MLINKEKSLCMCCMEMHEVSIIKTIENNIFKNEKVEYEAIYKYCDIAEEYYADEKMITSNDIAMKNAYRKKVGLLTSKQIYNIRKKYGISQSDLAIVLDWGEKTITRYESHQVQDAAHDMILRKIDDDPEWYISLLKKRKHVFSQPIYDKYFDMARECYESKKDEYLRKTIHANYLKYENLGEYCGFNKLDLDKVVEVIRYFSNSKDMKSLYKVKLMKLLWYADALSYKRFNHSITGLVYKALPMGAVPVEHDLIIDLKGVTYEEVDLEEGSGYHFISTNNNDYSHLTKDEILILDKVIKHFGLKSKTFIVETMHKEKAYKETKPNSIIQYKYAIDLSI